LDKKNSAAVMDLQRQNAKLKEKMTRIKDNDAALQEKMRKLKAGQNRVLSSGGNQKRKPHEVLNDDVDRYVAQILDPFTDYGAVVPDVHGYTTTSFSCAMPFVASTNADGRFMIAVRDGISRCLATSFVCPTPDVYGNSGFANIDYSSGWRFTADEQSMGWGTQIEHDSLIGAFSAYRPVAMGLRITYAAPPVDAAGRLAVGLYPPSQILPTLFNTSASGALTFDEFSQYRDSVTVSAIDGATCVWKPLTPEVEFRQTKPVLYVTGATPSWVGPTDNGTGSAIGSWDGDCEAYTAILAQSFNGATPGTGGGNAVKAAQGALDFCPNSQSPLIFIMGEGLPASTDVYQCELVVRYEGIVDNRGFSLAGGQQRLRQKDDMPMALAKVTPVKVAHSGGTPAAHHNWLDSVIGFMGKTEHFISKAAQIASPLTAAAQAIAAIV